MSTNETPGIRSDKRESGPWKLFISAAVVALVLSALLEYSTRTGVYLATEREPMLGLIAQLEAKVLSVGILLDSDGNEGESVHVATVRAHLDAAVGIAEALFQREIRVKHPDYLLTGTTLASEIDSVRTAVTGLRSLILEDLALTREAGRPNNNTEVIGRAYTVLVGGVDLVAMRINESIEEALGQLQAAQRFLLGLFLVLTFLFARLLFLSERRRLQRKQMLAASEDRFGMVCNSATDAIITIDETGRITFWNQAAERLFGWTAERASGRDLHQLIVPKQYRDAYLPALEVFHQTGEGAAIGQTIKLNGLRRDGSEFPVELSLAAMGGPGKWGAVGIVRDITDTVTLEEQLRQAQKMEIIGQLAGGVAHDFNNLLQIMQLNMEIASEKSETGEGIGSELGQIQSAVTSATDLTGKLLAFSRRQVLEYRDLDINDLVTSFIKISRRVLEEHVEIKFVPAKESVVIRADAGQIEQVLLNLSLNARDAMPDGGLLTIDLKSADVKGASSEHPEGLHDGSYCVVSVSDTGTGMTEEISNRIFEPFFTTKDVGKGTGLGLASVFGTITQHGGGVSFETEPGRGTVFHVYLPLASKETESTGDDEVPVSLGGTETILLAEDNDGVREVASILLKNAGYKVVTAADGQEAVDIFSAQGDRIELVIMDIIMPRMNGRQASDLIRQMAPQVRILFSTGYGGEAIASLLPEDDLTRLIQKPYRSEEFLLQIRSVLDA